MNDNDVVRNDDTNTFQGMVPVYSFALLLIM